MAARLRIDWDAQPLGKLSDAEIARRVGCSAAAARYARVDRGISPASTIRPKLTDAMKASMVPLLGTMPDGEIAERFGVNRVQVRWLRFKSGIANTLIDWSAEPLGSVPDIVLARKHGVCNKVVAEARWRRDIPKWQETRRCPCGRSFTAFHLRQRYCSYQCQRYHWQMVKDGYSPEMADVLIALWAFKKTAKEKNHGMAQLSRTAERHPGGARKAGGRRDRRSEGARGGAAAR